MNDISMYIIGKVQSSQSDLHPYWTLFTFPLVEKGK